MLLTLTNLVHRLHVILLASFYATELFERINQLTWYKKTLRQWVNEQSFSKGSKVLEAGCATGALSNYLAQLGLHITAIDFSQAMINRAKNNYDTIEFVTADVHHLPFDAQTFDIVLATSLINIVDNESKAINELARCCKEGGIVSILVPDSNFTDKHLDGLLKTIGNVGFSAAALKTWHKSAPKMNPQELCALLENEGLNTVSVKSYLQGMVCCISAQKSNVTKTEYRLQ